MRKDILQIQVKMILQEIVRKYMPLCSAQLFAFPLSLVPKWVDGYLLAKNLVISTAFW